MGEKTALIVVVLLLSVFAVQAIDTRIVNTGGADVNLNISDSAGAFNFSGFSANYTIQANFTNATTGSVFNNACNITIGGMQQVVQMRGNTHEVWNNTLPVGTYEVNASCFAAPANVSFAWNVTISSVNLTSSDIQSFSKAAITYEPTQINASYINATTGIGVSGTCQLNTSNTVYDMTEITTGLYQHNVTFTQNGSTAYKINCSATGETPLLISDTLNVRPILEPGRYYPGRSPSSVLFGEDGSHYIAGGNNGGSAVSTVLSYDRFGNNLSYNVENIRRGSLSYGPFISNRLHLIVSGEDATGSGNVSVFDIQSKSKRTQEFRRPLFSSNFLYDVSKDGVNDLFVSGSANTLPSAANTSFYRSNSFTISEDILPDIMRGSICLYTNGSLEGYVISGLNTTLNQTYVRLYNNSFTNLSTEISPVHMSSCQSVDLNQDGEIDIILQGTQDPGTNKRAVLEFIFINGSSLNINPSFINKTTFSNVSGTGSTGTGSGLISGDFNNDGYTDLVMAGAFRGFTSLSRLDLYLRNTSAPGLQFTYVDQITNYGMYDSDIAAYDYDFDGDLDLLASGQTKGNNNITILFNNTWSELRANQVPSPPTTVNAVYYPGNLTLSINWNNGSDDTTPTQALTYHVEVTDPSGDTIYVSGVRATSSNPANGYLGNALNRNQITFFNMTAEQYRIRVKSIDAGLANGSWSNAVSVLSEACSPPLTGTWQLDEDDCFLTNSSITFTQALDIKLLNNSNLTFSGTTLTTTFGQLNITIDNTSSFNLSSATVNSLVNIEGNGTADAYQSTLNVTGTFQGNNTFYRSTIAGNLTNNGTVILEQLNTSLQLNFSQNLTSIDTNFTNLNPKQDANILQYSTITIDTSSETGSVTASFNVTDTNDNLVIQNITPYTETLLFKITNATLETWITNHTASFNASGRYNVSTSFNASRPQTVTGILNITSVPFSEGFTNTLTTNFSALQTGNASGDFAVFSNLSNVTIGIENLGIINFTEGINIYGVNVTDAVKFGDNWIRNNASGLNRTANLTIINENFQFTPVIYRNNDICENCSNITYNGVNVSFLVTGFSNYSTGNNSLGAFITPTATVANFAFNVTYRYSNASNVSQFFGLNSGLSPACTFVSVNATDVADVEYNTEMNITATGLFVARVNYTESIYNHTINCSGTGIENTTTFQSFQVFPEGLYFQPLDTSSFTPVYRSAVITANLSSQYQDVLYSGVNNEDEVILSFLLENSTSLNDPTLQIREGSYGVIDLNHDGDRELLETGTSDMVLSVSAPSYYQSFTGTQNQILSEFFEESSATLLDYNFDGYIDFFACGRNQSGIDTLKYYQSEPGTQASKTIEFTQSPHNLPNIGRFCRIHSLQENNKTHIIGFGRNTTSTYNAFVATKHINGTEILTNLDVAGYQGDITTTYIGGYPTVLITFFNETSDEYNFTAINLTNHQTINLNLPAFRFATFTTADLDNDGKDEIIYSGSNDTDNYLFAYDVTATDIVENSTNQNYFQTHIRGSTQVYDKDTDGDLDIVITGSTSVDADNAFIQIYENTLSLSQPNAPPSQVQNVSAEIENSILTINWSHAQDNQSEGLYYNIRIGNVNEDIYRSGTIARSSNPNNFLANTYYNTTEVQFNISRQDCMYIQVQAIDTQFQTGPWSDVFPLQESTEILDNSIDEDCDGLVETSSTSAAETNSGSSGGGGGGGGGQAPLNTGNTDSNEEETPEPQEPPEETEESSDEPEVTLPQSQLETLIEQRGYTVKRTVNQYGDQATVRESIQNIWGIPLNPANITITVPKEIAANMDFIDPQGNYVIIEWDPIFGYENKDIAPYAKVDVGYTIQTLATAREIQDSIQTELTFSQDLLEEMQAQQEEKLAQTKEVLQTTTTIITDDINNQTIVELDLEFNDTTLLEGVDIIQIIPKCLLEVIQSLESDEIQANLPFEVIDADPVIRFRFDTLYPDQKIRYTINRLADQECLDQVETLSIAQTIHILEANYTPLQIAIPVMFTLFGAGMLLFLGSFTMHKHSKDLGTQQLIPTVKRLLRKNKTKEEIKEILKDKHKVDEALDAVTKHPLRNFFHTVLHGFSFQLSILLIILAFLDLTENALFTGDVFYAKIIISWVLMIYVFYHVGITKTIIGKEHRHVDKIILLGFFLLTIKNLVQYARAGYLEAEYVRPLFGLILRHNAAVETVGFIAGIITLLGATIYLTYKYHIGKKSTYNALFHEDVVIEKHSHLQRFWRLHVIILLFFVWAFSPVFEWLAVAVDSPIIIALLLFTTVSYMYHRIKEKKKAAITEIITDVTAKPDTFYEHLIDLFHYTKTLILGLAGIFVLHLITEIGIYLIPYILGTTNPIYFQVTDSATANAHLPLFFGHQAILPTILAGTPPYFAVLATLTYAVAWLGAVITLVVPLWIWVQNYLNKHKPMSKVSSLNAFIQHKKMRSVGKAILILALPSMLIAFFSGVFSMGSITSGTLYGVDITTNFINPAEQLTITSSYSLPYLSLLLGLAGIIGLLGLLALRKKPQYLTLAVLAVSAAFVLYYNVLFVYSLWLTVTATLETLATITITSTVIFVYWAYFILAAFIGLYVVGWFALLFMYIPTKIKIYIIKKIPFAKWRQHLLMPHIHFHHVHHHALHGEKIDAIKTYVEENVEHGHDPFIVLEQAYHKGWPVAVIEEAIYELGHEQHFLEAIHHVKTTHHNTKQLHILEHYLRSIPKEQHNDDLFVELEKQGWTEHDIEMAFKAVKLPPDEHKLLMIAEDLEAAEK